MKFQIFFIILNIKDYLDLKNILFNKEFKKFKKNPIAIIMKSWISFSMLLLIIYGETSNSVNLLGIFSISSIFSFISLSLKNKLGRIGFISYCQFINFINFKFQKFKYLRYYYQRHHFTPKIEKLKII